MSNEISNEDTQALLDAISLKCDELSLTPKQMLDGVSRSLLSIVKGLEYNGLKVDIVDVGEVIVNLQACENVTQEEKTS